MSTRRLEFPPENREDEEACLESVGVFSEEEIQSIMDKRESLDLNLQKHPESKDEYVKFIKYEMELLKLIQSRNMLRGADEEFDMSISTRINRMFKQAIYYNFEDMSLWLSYIKFCEQVTVFTVCVSYMIVGMLSVHSDEESLWRLAASWEYEVNNSVENSRQFLVRSLEHHPESKLLYMESFRLELEYAELKRKEAESPGVNIEISSTFHSAFRTVPTEYLSNIPWETILNPNAQEIQSFQDQIDQESPWKDLDYAGVNEWIVSHPDEEDVNAIMNCRIVEIVYDCASSAIPDISFLLKLYSISKRYTFTEKLQARIIRHLSQKFPKDESIWNTLARRELQGYHVCHYPAVNDVVPELRDVLGVDMYRAELGEDDLEYITMQRIKTCCLIYQLGLQQLKPQRMWIFYLDTLIEINKDVKILRKYKRKLLRCAFQKAHSEGLLGEKYYLHWASTLSNKKEKLSHVLISATEKHPNCLELWENRMNFHIARREEAEMLSVFYDAVTRLSSIGRETISLWKLLIQFYQNESPSRVEEIFHEGINQETCVSSIMKPMYLEWLVMDKADMQAARQAYQSMCKEPPLCLQLHLKMAALESMQPDMDVSRVVKCYEIAFEQFGKNNIDVWLHYMKFEKKHGHISKVKDVYQRALSALDERLAHKFIAEFCEKCVVKD